MSEPKAKHPLGPKRPPERKRPSVWATYSPAPRDEPLRPTTRISFYVVLTTWSGGRLAVRYEVGRGLPMEPVPAGGTYLFFPAGLIYVQEPVAEINLKIHRRLQQLQADWAPAPA